MTQTMAPTKKTQTWRLVIDEPKQSDVIELIRVDDEKTVDLVMSSGPGRGWKFPIKYAAQLAELLSAAAKWEVVEAEIADDYPRLDHGVINCAVAAARPRWMTAEAAQDMARDVVAELYNSGEVVITRDGEVWVP
jgi:hypothetical protein